MKSVTKSLAPHQCIHDPCTNNAVHMNFKSNQHITSVLLYACTKEIPTKNTECMCKTVTKKYNYLIT